MMGWIAASDLLSHIGPPFGELQYSDLHANIGTPTIPIVMTASPTIPLVLPASTVSLNIAHDRTADLINSGTGSARSILACDFLIPFLVVFVALALAVRYLERNCL
ncbi:hypothetical protein FPV67DRAFT_816520 [Lyophyllum atratum]|nr:hypothetical protein FPV67DRAFT_816520 [Lyophyllum atratum]